MPRVRQTLIPESLSLKCSSVSQKPNGELCRAAQEGNIKTIIEMYLKKS